MCDINVCQTPVDYAHGLDLQPHTHQPLETLVSRFLTYFLVN